MRVQHNWQNNEFNLISQMTAQSVFDPCRQYWFERAEHLMPNRKRRAQAGTAEGVRMEARRAKTPAEPMAGFTTAVPNGGTPKIGALYLSRLRIEDAG